MRRVGIVGSVILVVVVAATVWWSMRDTAPPAMSVDDVASSASGTLTLHGVAKRMTFKIDAKVDGAQVVLATTNPVPVRLADHQIEAPNIPGLSTVRGTGQFEFVVVLHRP